MKRVAAAFACGFLFAMGLGVSGMTQPGKVTAFLDLTGSWDPSLLFVMVGAISVYAVGYRLVTKRARPLLGEAFLLPDPGRVDRRLILGASIFGVGWGLAGYCPGPALVSLATLRFEPLVFVAAMLVGMAVHAWRTS